MKNSHYRFSHFDAVHEWCSLVDKKRKTDVHDCRAYSAFCTTRRAVKTKLLAAVDYRLKTADKMSQPPVTNDLLMSRYTWRVCLARRRSGPKVRHRKTEHTSATRRPGHCGRRRPAFDNVRQHRCQRQCHSLYDTYYTRPSTRCVAERPRDTRRSSSFQNCI